MAAAKEPTTTITIRVPESIRAQFDELAKATGRTRQYLALEALRRYSEVESWQVAQILDGIHAADVGDFAADEDVARVLNKYRTHLAEHAS